MFAWVRACECSAVFTDKGPFEGTGTDVAVYHDSIARDSRKCIILRESKVVQKMYGLSPHPFV